MKSEVDQHGPGQPLTGRVIHAVEWVGETRLRPTRRAVGSAKAEAYVAARSMIFVKDTAKGAPKRSGGGTPSSESEKRWVSHEAGESISARRNGVRQASTAWGRCARAVGGVHWLTVPRPLDCIALPFGGNRIFTRIIRSLGHGSIPGHRTR
jgi:hypothetical protein